MAGARTRRAPESGGFSEKIIGAVLFAVILLGTLVWGALPFAFGVALAAVIGSVELFSMFESKGQATPTAAVLGIGGSIAYVLLAHFRPIESFSYITFAIIFLSFMWYMLVLRHVKPTKAVALTIFAPLLTGFCLSFLVLIRDSASRAATNHNSGWWIVLFLIVLIWVYDICAWAVGRKIGRHKMAPTISPNKSWEGTIAATVGVLAASVLLRLIITAIVGGRNFPWFTYWVALVIGVIVVIFGPLGDLSESLMKRDYGIKDMGKLIPGHGGIMDRFDSTFFTAPVVFFFLFYFVLNLK
ncbi:MAG TPA: phosphatidate cytidylyltransferase [Candidatus Anoxymicrobiaceae bacterium]